MVSYMDAALLTSDIFIVGNTVAVAVLYPAYICRVSALRGPDEIR
jgi:hypothetical protein